MPITRTEIPVPGKVFGAMALVVPLMAVCYPAVKTGLTYAPPLRFAGLRTLMGGAVLVLWAVSTGRPPWPRTGLVGWIVPLGLVSTAFTYAFMFASPAFTEAWMATVLGNTQPLFIAVMASLTLSRKAS